MIKTGLLLALILLAAGQDKPATYEYPYPAGKSIRILQGNGVGTHQGALWHSWDFLIPVNDLVVAARAGTVVKLSYYKGRGANILVLHEDGTCATYGHLLRGSYLVKGGEQVLQGEPIAKIGPESGCPTPHLHFHVTESCTTIKSIPIKFKGNVTPAGGQVYASTTAEPADLSEIRLLRRTHPLLLVAVRLEAKDLQQEMRKEIDPALKKPSLASWSKPYGNLGSPPLVSLPKEARATLIDAIRRDFKAEWDQARPLYEKALKQGAPADLVNPFLRAITPHEY